ncbi:BTB/POZ domain-containing protein [Aspergillus mulundensis]|uniref:BTB domain-containing protein n=1 Tax=Aspergillus mulundensis TaxID=1810919 RepID=A0A3D8T465_9EURO|nr:hypothetical protein DSM5745_00110 [Aspergillus mulundensis]RDW92788.1 hypothetical protein DSM5745_00110 [Aspergillus mulundensis]
MPSKLPEPEEPVRGDRKFRKYFLGPAVRIYVGSEAQEFCIHETYARMYSAFIDKALSGPWKEATERKIHLPADEPEIFVLFLCWLYGGTIATENYEEGKRVVDVEYMELAKAYVLGDKLMSTGFCNSVIDAICEKLDQETNCDNPMSAKLPGRDVIQFIYENTLVDAPIRKLMVDIWWNHMKSRSLAEKTDIALPQPFAVDLAIAGLDRRGESSSVLVKSRGYYSPV